MSPQRTSCKLFKITTESHLSRKNIEKSHQTTRATRLSARPLQNTPFCPISASSSNFNPLRGGSLEMLHCGIILKKKGSVNHTSFLLVEPLKFPPFALQGLTTFGEANRRPSAGGGCRMQGSQVREFHITKAGLARGLGKSPPP